MRPRRQVAVLEEIARKMPPRTALKLRVMFAHWGDEELTATSELEMRNFLMTAASLIDRYRLVDGAFSDSQRALIAAETVEACERGATRH